MKKFMIALILALGFSSTLASMAKADETQSIDMAFTDWREALSSGSAEKIVALYADDATLLATLAAKPITNQKDRMNYFNKLTAKPKLMATVDEKLIRLLDEDDAVISGVYTFSFEEDGKVVKVPARYTFVYEKENNVWKIVEHHSSMTPSEK